MAITWTYDAPIIVAKLDYEAIRGDRIEAFLDRWAAFRESDPSLPDYDVQGLESDPAVIALEAAAYGDLHFRAQLNDTARAALLVDFATGADLDLHGVATRTPAHPSGLARLSGEPDAAYAARIIEARAGSSAAGPDEWWLTNARAADSRVRAVGLYYLGQGRMKVTLLSKVNGGIPDQPMLDAVSDKLGSTSVKPQGVVELSVESAVIETVDVVADVVLDPDAPSSTLDAMAAQARALHDAGQALDVDMTRYYLTQLLHRPGVYSISFSQPASDRLADQGHAFTLGSISLNLVGRQR